MISYLQIDKLTKSFGDLVLFEDITFGIAQGQKVGLIAKNGTGKTTLLNIIAGKEDYDSGAVVFRNDLRVGYLEQTPHYPDGLTVLQACFYSPNETVRLIAEYEQAMASGDHSDLEDILLRMDNLKAWDYEQRVLRGGERAHQHPPASGGGHRGGKSQGHPLWQTATAAAGKLSCNLSALEKRRDHLYCRRKRLRATAVHLS